ncbi:ammonia-forming cytochrome c nitrite reductase subunit c552 [Azospira restricta]|uniref:Ammonia-forming cytochrome c nitrite reductase subunit c552 n=1 Tax=Azospira restricta TaxID=404405 RepID=A0A974SQP2_9RHOO|nr:ammonia-forming cytochrome c nitrite reductase subunit c552 [Azospira restricta]QRJ64588.1 ammonia-forming cytochrome c nitrite reductase subunit c552 [Azospira restricta]
MGVALISFSFAVQAAGKETVKRTPIETLSIAGQTGRIESGQKFFGDAQYAGSDSCKSCHEMQHAEWRETWHAKMERWPSPDIIVGDFNDRVITYKDVKVKTKDGKEEKLTFQVKTHRQSDKFFFTVLDKDNPANDQTFEIAKVLGGKWDQHYEIKIGENYLPAPIRWSVAAKDWLISSYRPYEWVTPDGSPDGRPLKLEELPKGRFAEGKCSGCHTTGFEFYKDDVAGHWKAKENGKGEIGIACERCHGPASKHVGEAETAKAAGKPLDPAATTIVHPLKDLSPMQQTQVCAQCHGRNTNKKISDISFQQGFLPGDVDMTSRSRFWSYSGTSNPDEYKYFWPNDWAKRNRQQFQDFSKSAHANKAGMSCLTCHTFHGKAEGAQLRQKPEELCTTCHSGSGYAKRNNSEMFAGSPMHKAGVQCVDCHMPRNGYRSDKTASGPHQWDVSSHTFMVATPAMEKTQGIRSSCASCHEGQGKKMASGVQAPAFDTNTLDIILKQKQSMVRAEIDEVEKLLAKAPVSEPASMKLAEEARAKLNFVLLDGSFGVHNQEKAMAYVAEARKLAEKAVTGE